MVEDSTYKRIVIKFREKVYNAMPGKDSYTRDGLDEALRLLSETEAEEILGRKIPYGGQICDRNTSKKKTSGQ